MKEHVSTAFCLDCGKIKPLDEMDWIECNREGECKACKGHPKLVTITS